MNRNVWIGISINTLIFFIMILLGFKDYIGTYDFIKSLFGGDGSTYQYSLENNLKLFIMIFSRNSATAALIFASSPFLSFMGFISSSFNGYIVGSVVAYNINLRGYSLEKVLAYLLPHGIIELPTILYVAGMSFDLSIKFIRDREEFYRLSREYFRIFIIKAIPLLSLAAFIESFITPVIGSMV